MKKLTINGMTYQYQQTYIKEDNLWECSFVDILGNIAEVALGNLVSYDESLSIAKKELEALIKDNELEPGVDNKVVIWKHLDAETQRRILVLAKKIKGEEIGEWHSLDEDYYNWRKRMYAYTGIWFTKSQYYRL